MKGELTISEFDAYARTRAKAKSQQSPRPGTRAKSGSDAGNQDLQHPWKSLQGQDTEHHADLLGDSHMSEPMQAGSRAGIMRQLQQDYGNRYVQRLVKQVMQSRADAPKHVVQQPATLATIGIQRQIEGGEAVEADSGPEKDEDENWSGDLEGNFGNQNALYHTLNNFGKTPKRYILRVTNRGYAMLSLGTQFDSDREWTAFSVQRGKTEQTIYGLPPGKALHLRLYGERDYTDPNQSSFEGTLEVLKIKSAG